MIFLKKYYVFLIYIVFYSILYISAINGIGNTWDWTFPYFSEQMPNFFTVKSLSWSSYSLGSPLSYSSDYFLRFLISLTSFFKPEHLIFILFVLGSSIGSYMTYKILTLDSNKKFLIIKIILGLISIVNPTTTYTLFAGYYLQFISYILLIIFTYALLKYDGDTSFPKAVLYGLLLGFSSFQIQYLFIGYGIYILYLLFWWKKQKKIYIFLTIALSVLINIVWLTNFFIGTNNLSEISAAAIRSKTFLSVHTIIPLKNIISLIFSQTTSISKLYPDFSPIFFSFFSTAVIISIFTSLKRKNKILFFLLIIFITLVYFSAGKYLTLTVYPLSLLYPLFRESSHFAPMIIFIEVLLIGYGILWNKFLRVFVGIYSILFLILNGYVLMTNIPYINYEKIRTELESFKKYYINDDDTYRIVDYPFWNAYAFNFQKIKYDNNGTFPLSNTGRNMLVKYSKKDFFYLQNSSQLMETPLYKFLKNDYDISIFEHYNVRYIIDFSSIYESNAENYLSKTEYGNDEKIIKNIDNFFELVLEKNKNKVKKIDDHVIEITNYLPRIFTDNGIFSKINDTTYDIQINDLKKEQKIYFLENFHKDWQIYLKPYVDREECSEKKVFESVKTIECKEKNGFIRSKDLLLFFQKPLHELNHKKIYGYANTWTVDPYYIKKNFSPDYYLLNSDGSINIKLTLYFKSETPFLFGLLLSSIVIIGSISYIFLYLFLSKRR